MVIPGDPRKYGEITQRFLTILKRYGDKVEQFSADEAFMDVTDGAGDWMGATLMAQMIRDDIRRECGSACTVSIGIAPNKLVAKLASESVKPNGLTCVQPKDVERFVQSRPMRDVCGIGPGIERRLAMLGITSMATLKNASLHQLVETFKSYGNFLYYAARGMGDDHVNDGDEPPKSVGHSYTFPSNLLTENEARVHLLALCDRVAVRLRKQGLLATHIAVYGRYGDFTSTGAGKQFREPFEDGLALFKAAWAMIKDQIDLEKGVRLLGISASGLLHAPMPHSMFKKDDRMHGVLGSLDRLSTRYGSGVWQRAATMKTVFKERVSGWHYDHEM
jgi:DNA polymerase-4